MSHDEKKCACTAGKCGGGGGEEWSMRKGERSEQAKPWPRPPDRGGHQQALDMGAHQAGVGINRP
jgi:hypothetical protein